MRSPFKSYARVAAAVGIMVVSLAMTTTPAFSAKRSMSEFLSRQGTTNIFIPPVPDYIGWTSPFASPPVRFASVDYAGLAAKWIRDNGGPSLPTTISGNVNERVLPDGRTEVTVNLNMANALTWAIYVDPAGPGDQFATNPPIFGYRAQEIVATPGLTPGLSTGKMQVKFKNTGPGAPLPDLVDAFILGHALPGQELITLSFQSDGFGPLRAAFGVAEGTPGETTVTQTGLFMTSFKGATNDGFPAERVTVKVAP